MNILFIIITITAVVAIIIFAQMRNQQAGRNDERRGRLEQKQEEMVDQLNRNNLPTENSSEDES